MASVERVPISIDRERSLLTGLITSDRYASEILPLLNDPSVLESQLSRYVVDWIKDYHNHYNKAPGPDISAVYHSRKAEIRKEEDRNSIEVMLRTLSEEYEKNDKRFNEEFQIDCALKYIKERSTLLLADKIKGYALAGKVEEAESLIVKYNIPETNTSEGIDVLEDNTLLDKMFFKEDEALFRLPGVIGDLCGDFLRGDLSAVAGPMKRGKTFFMMDIFKYGILANMNTFFFSLEMKEYLLAERIFQNFLGGSIKGLDRDIPFFDESNNIQYKRIVKPPLEYDEVQKYRDALRRDKTAIFKLFNPNEYTNIAQMDAYFERLYRKTGKTPDVVIVDYLDITSSEPGSPKEERHKINTTWMAAKKFATKWNCFFFTGSQMGKIALRGQGTEENLSEDIRKLAHISAMLFINQSPIEKKLGIARLSSVSRNGEYTSSDEVVVLQDFGISRPMMDSRWKKDVSNLSSLIKSKEDQNETPPEAYDGGKKGRRR